MKPTTEKAFQVACKEGQVDIISLDLTQRLPFQLKFPTLNAAIQRGVYFEISIAPCIRDSSLRRNVISNAIQLIRVARNKNILLSTGAERVSELRSPHDVISLGCLFGLNLNQSFEAMKCAHDILLHAYSRKHVFKTVMMEITESDDDKQQEKKRKRED